MAPEKPNYWRVVFKAYRELFELRGMDAGDAFQAAQKRMEDLAKNKVGERTLEKVLRQIAAEHKKKHLRIPKEDGKKMQELQRNRTRIRRRV